MTTELLTPDVSTPLVRYNVTDAEIAALRDRYTGLTADTSQGYEAVRIAIGECRDLRVAVEKRRVELKADALAWGRAVDVEAKRITGLLVAIEDPLKAQKDAVDAEKERRRQEAIEAKRRELEAQLRVEREAEEARLRAEREAEELRLAQERRRLEAERLALEEARRKAAAEEATRREEERRQRAAEEAQLRGEREAIEAERRLVQQERERAEREEYERQALIRAEREAVERLERERISKAKRDAELAAIRPDVEKLAAYADQILALANSIPKVKARKVAALLATTAQALSTIATDLKVQVTKL